MAEDYIYDDEPQGYIDDTTGEYTPYDKEPDVSIDPYLQQAIAQSEYDIEQLDAQFDRRTKLARAAELKRKSIYRKADLKYEQDGTLINDSDSMLRAKEVANAGIHAVDWFLEATENVLDYGQGDWITHRDGFQAERNGRKYNMQNKDFIGAKGLTRQDLIDQYNNAEDNPDAEGGVYNLRKFDGYNDDGSTKYIYKLGYAHDGAYGRYKDQYTQDGWELIGEKKFAGALDWENKWHALDENLDHRVMSSDKVMTPDGLKSRDEASGINFGAGKTELYDQDLLGLDTGTSEDYARNLERSKFMYQHSRSRPWDSNFVDAFQAGALGLVTGTADALLDLLPGDDNTLLNDYQQEWADKFVGYDRHYAQSKVVEAEAAFNRGDIASGLWSVAQSAPSFVAESLPYMAGMSIGVSEVSGTAGALRLVANVNKAKAAGASASDIKKIVDVGKASFKPRELSVYNKYKDSEQMLKGLNLLAKGAGVETINLVNTNRILDERIKAKLEAGEDPSVSVGEATALYAFEMPFTLLDKLSFDHVSGISKLSKATKPTTSILKSSYNKMPDTLKPFFTNKLLNKTGSALASMTEEGFQEYTQTWGEIIGQQYGISEKDVEDILRDEKNRSQAFQAAIAGAGAGGLMHMVPKAPSSSLSFAKSFAKSVNTKIAEKRAKANIDTMVNNMDQTDFDFYAANESKDIEVMQDNWHIMKDAVEATKKAKDISELTDSAIPEVRDLGNAIREQSMLSVFDNNDEYNEKAAEEFSKSSFITTETLNALGVKDKILGDSGAVDEEVMKKISLMDTDERQAYMKELYLNATPEQKRDMHKIDNNTRTSGTSREIFLPGTNIYSMDRLHTVGNSKYSPLYTVEKSVFDKDNGIIHEQVNAINNKADTLAKTIQARLDRLDGHKIKRQEALSSGSAVNEFSNDKIDVNEYKSDPKTFMHKLRSFGTKSKIEKNIRTYSDESLKEAFNDPSASKAMKAAIESVFKTRNAARIEIAKVEEQDGEDFATRINSSKNIHTRDVLKNISSEVAKKSTYKYSNEVIDQIQGIMRSYSLAITSQDEGMRLLQDVAEKLYNSSGLDKKKAENLKSAINSLNIVFDSDENSSPKEYNKTLVAIIGEAATGLKSAKNDEIIDANLMDNHNIDAYNTILKYAKKSSIRSKQEVEFVHNLINVAEDAKNITSKEAEIFRRVINARGVNATDTELTSKQKKIYRNTKLIKSSKQIDKEMKKLDKKQYKIESELLGIEQEINSGNADIEQIRRKSELKEEIKNIKKNKDEIVYLSHNEKIENEYEIEELYDIISDEELVDSEKQALIEEEFTFCIKR
jgi:hypothetical protein